MEIYSSPLFKSIPCIWAHFSGDHLKVENICISLLTFAGFLLFNQILLSMATTMLIIAVLGLALNVYNTLAKK